MCKIILIAALLSVLLGCGDATAHKEAKFEITDTQKDTTQTGYPKILVTVKNVGDAIGYDVWCQGQAKDSNGVIIDSDYTWFAGGGYIDPGESARDDVVFSDLSSHEDYATVEYELGWETKH